MSSSEVTDDRYRRVEARAIGEGAAGGAVAGVAMGLIFQFGTDLMPALGELAGASSIFLGWVVHMAMSVLYGISFAVIMAYPPLQSFMGTFEDLEYVFAGVTYAVMIAAVTITVLPFILELPWESASSQNEGVPGPGLGGLTPALVFGAAHLVYGAILGYVYAAIGERTDD